MDSIKSKPDKFTWMTTAPVEKLVLSLAAPSIAIMLITSIYNMADTYFVAALGTSQVAAVGIAFPLMSIIQAIGFFFGQGVGNFTARALGAQNPENASRMAATGLVTGFCIMAVLALVLIFNLEPLVDGLGATESIRPYAIEYLLFILLASPWMVAAMVLNQLLRFQGSASIAMVGVLIGAALNIILDPVFIFVLGLGVKGASIATMLCQMLGFFILLCYGCTRKGNIRINLRHFSPSVFLYKEIFKGGIPALLRQGLMSVATIIINLFARPYGDAAIAGISISSRITMFAISVVLGFGQGFQPVCGFNYGAQMYGRVKKAFWFSVRVCTICLAVASIGLAIFAPQIIALFRKDDLDVITIGARGLRLHCISLPLSAGIIMVNMMTQTMGKALEASIVATARQGFLLIPCLFILNHLSGLLGIQLAMPVSEILSLAIVVPILIKTLRGLSAHEKRPLTPDP